MSGICHTTQVSTDKKMLDVTTDFFLSLSNPNFLACYEVQQKTEKKIISHALITQGMMQCRPNPTEKMMSWKAFVLTERLPNRQPNHYHAKSSFQTLVGSCMTTTHP